MGKLGSKGTSEEVLREVSVVPGGEMKEKIVGARAVREEKLD